MQRCECKLEELMDYRNRFDMGIIVCMLDQEGWSVCKGENRLKM